MGAQRATSPALEATSSVCSVSSQNAERPLSRLSTSASIHEQRVSADELALEGDEPPALALVVASDLSQLRSGDQVGDALH